MILGSQFLFLIKLCRASFCNFLPLNRVVIFLFWRSTFSKVFLAYFSNFLRYVGEGIFTLMFCSNFILNYAINCKMEVIWSHVGVLEEQLFFHANIGHVSPKDDVC